MAPTITWQALPGVDAATPVDVAQLEVAIGYSLPHDYAAWLLQFNGGKPMPDYWQFQARWAGDLAGLDEDIELYILYGQGLQARNLVARWKDLQGRIPHTALPIGDAVSPVLLLLLDGPECGQVKLWLPDVGAQHNQLQASQLGHVADSFGEFIRGLKHVGFPAA